MTLTTSQNAKWGIGTLGTSGGTVTWNFTTTPGRYQDFTAFDGAAQNAQAIRSVFAFWESVADIDFVEVGPDEASGIQVGWRPMDGAHYNLASTQWTWSGNSTRGYSLTDVEIAFDTAEAWQFGASTPGYNLQAVAFHAVGHALGLDHSDDARSVMHETSRPVDGPSVGDIQAVRDIYGVSALDTTPDVEAAGSGSADIARFLNTATGTHFYTASVAERDIVLATLPQYRLEGNAFDTVSQGAADLEVFRFLNTDTGTHFYTASEAERDLVIANLDAYAFEGVAYRASSDDGDGTLDALYRFQDTRTGVHFYTSSEEEVSSILQTLPGYRFEGVAFYVDFA